MNEISETLTEFSFDVETLELTRAGSEAMVRLGDCAGTEVYKDMNEEFTTDSESALPTAPVVYLGEASRAAASFNHALQRTAYPPSVRASREFVSAPCTPPAPPRPSLSLGRSAA